MSIKARIQDDIKQAMRSHDKETLANLRLISAALKQKEVDERIELNNEQIVAVLEKMIKQRRESIAMYESGHRPDLIEKEMAEIKLIQRYMPEQLTDAQIDEVIEKIISNMGVVTARDMGKVMAQIKPLTQGRVDMSIVSAKIKKRLGEAS